MMPTRTQFRFATWNVNFRRLREGHLTLLRRLQPDILALQEVNAGFFETLEQTGMFQDAGFSLLLRPPGQDEGRSRRIGCALFCAAPLRFSGIELIRELPLPERAITAKVEGLASHLVVCGFHTPPGVTWKKLKPESHVKLAKWLAGTANPCILGIDANAPKVDHPDIHQNEWWWKEEPLLLGAEPLHSLKDALRLHLDDNPELLDTIRSQRPRGPLATSYVRGNKFKRTPSRYDFIYVTSDIRVQDIQYLYEEAIEAGSDHAIVVADLELA
jgi:exonuclease III